MKHTFDAVIAQPTAEAAASMHRGWIKRTLMRVGEGLLTLLLLAMLCFTLLRAAPGGPFDSERELSVEQRQQLVAQYGLDRPIAIQFARYVGDVAQGDLGRSFQYPDYQVSELLRSGFAVSGWLGGWALLLALVIGVPLGLLSGARAGTLSDSLIAGGTLLGLALPKFVIAPLLILLFAVQLGLLPAGGWNADDWRTAVLPVTALCLPNLAAITRLTRHAVIESMASDYVRAARARGIEGLALIQHHVLKPTLLVVLAWLAPALIAVITGSTVIEQIFGIPGVGRYFVQGALNRDYTLVMGVALAAGTLIVIVNLIVDALRAWIDPRLS
ncbi:MAG: ABC transporter permease subunit [Pseudomonadota bacterium]|nr:ABC transporter permease subunit [Pseudomonadota bacterium]